MSSLSTTMTAAVERGMRFASVEFARDVIAQLASEGVLTCSAQEAAQLFDFESVQIVSSRSKASKKRESAKSKNPIKKSSKPKITAKPAVIIPFCGEVQEDWCGGVKFNHGLHTQCTNGRSGEDDYCKTCRKHADNSATGKPPYGDINDRSNFNVDYRDPKGKLTLPYANVVEKLGISMDAANTAAATLGWTIPTEQLVKRVSKRGRPAKSAAVSDSESESDGESKTKKKRGRPAKNKTAAPTQEDQIAQLVAEAYAETTTNTVVKKVVPKKFKVKKPKLTPEQKEAAKLAKKEAALALKEEKAAAKTIEKAQKDEAIAKVKAEKKALALKAKQEKAAAKKAEREAAKLVKKEAALALKEEKAAAKAIEKAQKDEAIAKVKAEKKALALKAKQEKAAVKKAEREAAKLRKKEAAEKLAVKELSDEKAQDENVVVTAENSKELTVATATTELVEEEIIDSSDDEVEDPWDGIEELNVEEEEEEGIDLSSLPPRTVGGVEFLELIQDGQIILLDKQGEPVGIYDAETDTVQECEFDEE